MKKGACTAPGIQSSEKRTLVSAPAGIAAMTTMPAASANNRVARFINSSSRLAPFAWLELHPGCLQDRAGTGARIVGDGQALRKIAAGRARCIDTHLGEREGLGVRRGIEHRAFCARNEYDVLFRPHARGDR